MRPRTASDGTSRLLPVDVSDGTSMVMNVKLTARFGKPEVVVSLEWVGRVIVTWGWRTDGLERRRPPGPRQRRFLAGYRRVWMFDPRDVEAASAAVADDEQDGGEA